MSKQLKEYDKLSSTTRSTIAVVSKKEHLSSFIYLFIFFLWTAGLIRIFENIFEIFLFPCLPYTENIFWDFFLLIFFLYLPSGKERVYWKSIV